MKIAIVGAHGVGKTTLATALGALTPLATPVPTPMHNPVPGTSKSLQDCTDEEVIRLSQRRYTERIVQEQTAADLISDGSVLHEWVYATIRLTLGIFPTADQEPRPSITSEVLLNVVDDFTKEALSYAEQTYDQIFFLPIEFPLPREGAPISDRFQYEAHRRLFELVSLGSIPVRTLQGTHEERISAALAHLDARALV